MSKFYKFLEKYSCTSTAMLPSFHAEINAKLRRYQESVIAAQEEEEFIAGEQAKSPVVVRAKRGRKK